MLHVLDHVKVRMLTYLHMVIRNVHMVVSN